jgi:hypothetical protein
MSRALTFGSDGAETDGIPAFETMCGCGFWKDPAAWHGDHAVIKRAVVTMEKRMWHIARDRIVDARNPLHAQDDAGKTDSRC